MGRKSWRCLENLSICKCVVGRMWANVGVEEMIHHVVGGKDDADRHGREKEKG